MYILILINSLVGPSATLSQAYSTCVSVFVFLRFA